jgi:hypothetical protein
MEATRVNDLLPTAAEVKCQLAVDLPLQLRGMLMMTKKQYDPERFVEYYVSLRNRDLMQRLELVVSKADLELAQRGGRGLDIGALAQRVPSAYAMWVMITALTAKRAMSVALNDDTSDQA